MKNINEHFRPLNEDMKYEALSQLRELQSQLVGISFLSVIAIMKPNNPLKKKVLAFQDDLDKLSIEIGEFISDAKNDVEYEGEEDEVVPEEAPEEEVEAEEETEEDKDAEKEDKEKAAKEKEKEAKKKEKEKKKSEPEDSSKPKV
jgi:hypothetical protein